MKRRLMKYLFMRGLIDHEKQQRTRHYLKSAAECTSKAIVSLELSDQPVRSVKQARQLEGIGGETCAKLAKLEKERKFSSLKPIGLRFVSSAGAILVALLDCTDEELYKGHSQDRPVLISEGQVKRRASNLSEEPFLEEPVLGLGEGFCKAWWRLEVLIKRGYIRRRSYRKEPVLQLLPLGRDCAQRLRGSMGMSYIAETSPMLPVSPGLARLTGHKQDSGRNATAPWDVQGDLSVRKDDALYTNDDGKDGVVMLVDAQEWGGDRVGLGDLCRMLDQTKIRYKTRRLPSGDYSWFWRVDGVERTLPCLVERKRADDVARTLKEGRFWSQVRKMVAWKKDFLSRGVDCSLHYILEGEPEDYVVQCQDGCQGVGKCGNPTLTQVRLAIEDLKRHSELQVKLTDSIEVTIVLLSSLTADLIDRASKGDYDELIVQEMSKTNDEENDAHLDDSDVAVVTCSKEDQRPWVSGLIGQRTEFQAKNKELMRPTNIVSEIVVDSDDDELAKPRQDMMFSVNKTDQKFDHYIVDRDLNLVANTSRSDSDFDEDLALAIEKSKTDVTCRSNSFEEQVDDISVPLMQYHCSLSKSVTCTTISPKKRHCSDGGYRPKINKMKSYDAHAFHTAELNARSKSNEDMNRNYMRESDCSSELDSGRLCSPSGLHRQSTSGASNYSKSVPISALNKLDKNFDLEYSCRSDTHSKSTPFGFANNTKQNKEKSNWMHKEYCIDLDKPETHTLGHILCSETKTKATVKRKKKDLNLSPKKDYLERNVSAVDSDRNLDGLACSKYKRQSKTLKSVPKVSLMTSRKKSDKNLGYISDEEQSSCLERLEVRTTTFGPDSDTSGSDGLPDLEAISSSNRKVTLSDSDEENQTTKLKARLKKLKSDPFSDLESEFLSSNRNAEGTSLQLHVSQNSNMGAKTKQTRRKTDNYKIVNDGDIEQKIDTIVAVLPQLDREKCFWLLHRFLGSVDCCIEHVLQEENKLKPGDVIEIDS